MPRRRKGAVRKGHGAMCNICGMNCGKGGALARHVESVHGVPYAHYKTCFYSSSRVIANAWDEQVSSKDSNKAIVTHVLGRKFIRARGVRGTPRAANVPRTVTPDD